MRLKTDTHILCSDCRWVGFKEDLYLHSHSLGQVRAHEAGSPWHHFEQLQGCCAQVLVAPDMLHFQILSNMGPAHSPNPLWSLWPSRAASGEVRSPAAVPPPAPHAVSQLLGTGCMPKQDMHRGNTWGSCAEVHCPKFYPNKIHVP